MPHSSRLKRLDDYYRQVTDIILKRQDWITGLLPAITAVNTHGDYTDAWVCDNVYSILSVWDLDWPTVNPVSVWIVPMSSNKGL